MTALQQAAADLLASVKVHGPQITNRTDEDYSPRCSFSVVLTCLDAQMAISAAYVWPLDRRTTALNDAVANGIVFG